MLNAFLKKIENKEAIIAVVGLGYVGLPLMLRFAQIGFRVLGIDTDNCKNEMINANQSYIKHISSEDIKSVSHLISATDDFSQIADADAIILCVPTPLNTYREPDLSYVINTTEMVEPYLRPGQLLSLESTTYPGTTNEELLPRVERNGLKVGEDFFLVYSPEREDPGNPNFTTSTIPKVCGGHTSPCRKAGVALYSAVIDEVVPMSSTKAAEMTKLLENIHRSVNIGLANEMKVLADKMDIDIFEVIDAAATKPFGFVPYYPGPGIGGHCIPIDPFYLTWKAREFGMHTRFIELSGEINNSMPKWVVNKVADALNSVEKAIKNSRILVLGVAYKCDIDDMRESPSLDLISLLREKQAIVSYCDPYVPELSSARGHGKFDMTSVSINPEIIATYDCVLLATSHKVFDYEMIANNAKLIVDTRGKFRKFKESNIVSA